MSLEATEGMRGQLAGVLPCSAHHPQVSSRLVSSRRRVNSPVVRFYRTIPITGFSAAEILHESQLCSRLLTATFPTTLARLGNASQLTLLGLFYRVD